VTLREYLIFAAAMLASFLPHRHWERLPGHLPMASGSFVAGLAVLMAGMAIGIPGFLDHAHMITSGGLDAALGYMNKTEVYRGDLVIGNSGLSLFTFLLLTPKGWLTDYLVISGSVRAAASWFDDPVGDPILTGIDEVVSRTAGRARAKQAQIERALQEGPEVHDRLVLGHAVDLPDCDFVVVSSRQKPGWAYGVAVYTQQGVYRIGLPIERTVAGHIRTLYPLTEHKDFEVIRKSVEYELPGDPPTGPALPSANERSE
jgi:hypothetical protein